MRDPKATDAIAREAARLLEAGGASTVREAIHLAADGLGLAGAPRPGPGRVRKHARGRAMQALGAEAYDRHVEDVLRDAEQLMTLIDETFDRATPILAGRGARGEVDGDASLHLRIYGDVRNTELAEVLVEHGYDEPAFETAETRHGRLSRLRLMEDDVEIVLTLCPARLEADAGRDLFTGRAIETVDLPALRSRLDGD